MALKVLLEKQVLSESIKGCRARTQDFLPRARCLNFQATTKYQNEMAHSENLGKYCLVLGAA